jgi:single-stranded-DNA-specific exonuclease
MLTSKTRWKQQSYSTDEIQKWQEKLGISTLVAKLLMTRGFKDIDEARQMLHTQDVQFHDPFLLNGMKEAVERIHHAIEKGEKIRIYGDYDCDGVSSTTLFTHVLRQLGATFDYYIPNRFTEGYGLNNAALDQAKLDNVSLVVTVDTGISAREQIAYGESIGLEFIVTDHHEPPELLPECVAVINPKKPGCSYPYKYLAGAGVAFKLGQALLGRVPLELVDLATIGTIADLVPLTGENRLIAFHGLIALNNTKHIGLEALIEVAGLTDEVINERHVGFALGPRINASGRLETADKAVQLLTSQDKDQALQLAEEIDSINQQRQTMVDEITKEAIEWVEEKYPNIKPKALVVAREGWNAGVIGIVASRLVERYYLPTIVLAIDEKKGIAKGSARSIEGFDMYQALCQCEEWLPHFGGHPMAAGMTLEAENLVHLRQRLDQLAEQWIKEDDLKPVTWIDISCQVDEITLEAIQELDKLAPYGVGNLKPMILLEKVNIKELRQVGTERQHLKCQLEQKGAILDGIGFSLGERATEISMGAQLDVLGQLDINEWNGTKKPQIMVKDLRVEHRQFFDWRATKHVDKKWQDISSDQHVALCRFREGELTIKKVPDHFHPITFPLYGNYDEVESQVNICDINTFIFVDLPQTMEQFKQVCQTIRHGKRFYLLFDHQEKSFFSPIPNRDHFKWYYAFLQKQGSFDFQRMAPKLAEHKGWTLDSIQFMTKVFLELQFAKIEDGKVCLHDRPLKQDLETSKTYLQKQEEILLEQELIYSPYSEVIQILEKLMIIEEKKQEDVVHGF